MKKKNFRDIVNYIIDIIGSCEYNKTVGNKFLQSRNLFRSTKTRLYAEIRSTDGCFFFYIGGNIWRFELY